MRAQPFKQDSGTARPDAVTNTYVAEALAKQAALRPKKTPPKILSITPTLPKRHNKHRRRPK